MTHSLFRIPETELAAHSLKWTIHPEEPSLKVSGVWDLAPTKVPHSKVFFSSKTPLLMKKITSPVSAFKEISTANATD